MEPIIAQIHALASTADEAGKKKILQQLRSVSFDDLEDPRDYVQRINYRGLEIAVVKIACDLKLFDMVAEKGEMMLDELVKETGAAKVLPGRILRYLSSKGMITEPGEDIFAPSKVTKALAVKEAQGGIVYHFDSCGSIFHLLPEFLKQNKYQDTDDLKHGPFQVAYNTEDSIFEYWSRHLEGLAPFNEYMAHRGRGRATWLSVFPEKLIREAKCGKEGVLFVGIGGGIGRRCAEFKAKYPDVEGRVVVQALPHAIGMALKTEDTKFYYLRQVLHDWPDAKCQEILKNIIPAMGKESVILIDDIVLPGANVHWEATQLGLTMAACLAGRERTRSQWEEILGGVGLVIEGVWTYTDSLYESVLVVKRK